MRAVRPMTALRLVKNELFLKDLKKNFDTLKIEMLSYVEAQTNERQFAFDISQQRYHYIIWVRFKRPNDTIP